LTNTSTKEVAYVYNDYVTYDFDKFIFNETALSSLATEFGVKNPSDTNAEPITPTVEEVVLTVDDDKFTGTSLTITKVAGSKKIPANTATLYNKDGSFNSALNAPEITFDNSITAKGLIASEDKDNACYVHLSYVLEKTVTGSDPIKCGSLYIKLKYNNTEIDGYTISPKASCTIASSLK
jgi:hypothetical protein